MTIGLGGLGNAPLGGNAPGSAGPQLQYDPRYVILADALITTIAPRKNETSMKRFSKKYLPATWTLTVDFVNQLETGETLTDGSQQWTPSVYADEGTGDNSPQSVCIGQPAVSGSKVMQIVSNGIDRVTYKFVVAVRTSLNRTLVQPATMKVVAA